MIDFYLRIKNKKKSKQVKVSEIVISGLMRYNLVVITNGSAVINEVYERYMYDMNHETKWNILLIIVQKYIVRSNKCLNACQIYHDCAYFSWYLIII